MNYFVALSSTQDTAEQIEFFFSKANLVALFNKLCSKNHYGTDCLADWKTSDYLDG